MKLKYALITLSFIVICALGRSLFLFHERCISMLDVGAFEASEEGAEFKMSVALSSAFSSAEMIVLPRSNTVLANDL